MAVQNASHFGLHEATTEPQTTFAHQIRRCYHCGLESSDSKFKYYDNKKLDQPRFQCRNCSKLFTLGCHGRPQGKTYKKKRNQDPKELRNLPRQCPHCNVPNHAAFKYYNNRSPSQPRFKCLSCEQQFQMHLVVEGHERHLVHTLAKPKRSCTAKEPALAHGNAVNDSSSPVRPCNSATVNAMPWGVEVAPSLSDEDADLVNFIEDTLNDEHGSPHAESWPCSSTSWLPACDTSNFLPPANALNYNPPIDPCCATVNAMPWGKDVAPSLSDGDADLVNFIHATLNDEHEAHVENNLDTISSHNATVDVPLTLMVEGAMMIPMDDEQLLEVESSDQSWACSSASWPPPCDTIFNLDSPCNNNITPVPVQEPATCGDSCSSAGSPVDPFGFPPSEAFSFQAAMDLQATCDWNEGLEEADVDNLWA